MTIVSTPVPEGGAPFRTGLDADYAHPIEYGDGYWGEEAECVPPSPGREAGPALWDPAGLPIPSSREMDLAMAYNLGHPNPYPFTGRAPRSRAQGAPLRPRSPSPPAELPLPFVPGLEPGCYAGSRTLVRAASPPEAVRAAGLVNDVDYESLGYERMDSVEVSGDGNCFLYALSAHLHAQDFHSLAHGKDPTREGLRAPEYLEMMNTRQAQLRRQVCDHIRAACQGDGERGSEFLSVFRHSGMWDHLQPQQARECIGPVGDPAGRTLEDYLWLMGSPSLGVWTPSEFVAEAAKCFRVDILCFVRNLGRPAGRAPVRLDTYLSGAPPGTRVRQVFVEFLHYDGASGHYNALWPRGVPYGPTRFWHRATGPAPSAPVVLLSVSSAASRSSRATESLGPPGEQVGAARTPPDGRGEDEANTPAAPPAARGEGPPAGPPDPRAVRAFRREAGRPALLTQRRAHRPTGRLRGRPGRLERQPAERARLPPGVDGEGEFSTASSDTDWDTEGAGRVYRKVNGRGMWGWTVPATHPRYAREDHRPLWRDAGVLSEVSEYVVRNQHRRACDIRGSDDVASVTTTEWLRRAALADPGDLRDAPFLTGWDGHVLGGSEVPRHLLVDDMLDMDTFVWTGPLVDSLRRHLKCLAPVSESREAPSGIPANLKVYSHRAPGETELLSLDPGPRIRKLRKRAGRAADFGPSALLGSLSGGETSDQVFLYVDTAASEGAFRVLFAVLRYCLSDGPAADLGSHVAAGNTGGSVTPSNTQHMRNSLHTRPERACYIPGSGNKLYGRHELRRFADVMQDDRVLEHVLAPESEVVREEVRQLWPTHCRLLVLSFFRRRSLCERRHRPLRCTQHENYANDLTKDQAVGEAHAILGQYLELDTDAADVYGALWIGADLQLGVTRKDDLGQWLFCRADVERLDLRGMPAARFLEPRYMQRAGLALLLPDGLARSQFRGCRANLYNWGGSKVLGVGVEGQTPASEVWAATSPVARRRTPMPEGVCDFLVGRHRRKVLRHGREWAALASSYRGDSVQFIIYNGMPAHVKKTQPIINGSAVHEAISTLVAYGANAHCVVPGTMHKRGEVVVNKLFTALGLMSREGNPLRVELGIPLRAQSGTGGVPPQLTLRQCAANALVAVNERIRALDCTKLRCVPWADMLQIWWAYAKQWKAAHDMLVERPRPFPMPHGVAEHFYRGMGAMTVVLNANLERWHATNWRTIAERTGQLGAPCLDAFRVKVLLGHEAVRGLTPLKNLRRQMHLVVRRVQRSKGSARVLLASVAELLVQAFPVDEMWPLQAHELSRCLAPILKLYAYEALTNTREHTIVHMDLLTFRGHDPDVLPEAHPYDGHEPLDWKVPRLRQLVYLQAGGVEGRGRGELASAARPGGAWVGYLRGDSAWDMLADPVAGDAMRGKARHAIAEQSAARAGQAQRRRGRRGAVRDVPQSHVTVPRAAGAERAGRGTHAAGPAGRRPVEGPARRGRATAAGHRRPAPAPEREGPLRRCLCRGHACAAQRVVPHLPLRAVAAHAAARGRVCLPRGSPGDATSGSAGVQGAAVLPGAVLRPGRVLPPAPALGALPRAVRRPPAAQRLDACRPSRAAPPPALRRLVRRWGLQWPGERLGFDHHGQRPGRMSDGRGAPAGGCWHLGCWNVSSVLMYFCIC
uniref:OTU domain-containing protein n=1 Tax=Auxenochlorella protothecoides TaxID=3075 RepID=A0A1D2A729_AUXPR